MGNCKLPCDWVGVLMTPPNYGKIRQAGGVKVGRGAGGGAAGRGESHDGGEEVEREFGERESWERRLCRLDRRR